MNDSLKQSEVWFVTGSQHLYGPETLQQVADNSRKVVAALDAGFARLLDRLAGTASTVLVTADHGFVDVAADRRVELSAHPVLKDCLALPLCGEQRLSYAYVRAGCDRLFEDYLDEHLGQAIEWRRSAALLQCSSVACNAELWGFEAVIPQGLGPPNPWMSMSKNAHPTAGQYCCTTSLPDCSIGEEHHCCSAAIQHLRSCRRQSSRRFRPECAHEAGGCQIGFGVNITLVVPPGVGW